MNVSTAAVSRLLETSADILRVASEVLDHFDDLPEQFAKDHDSYCLWLINQLKQLAIAESFRKTLAQIGIDWMTLHYRTLHPREECSRYPEWIQIGIPIDDRLKPLEQELQVYTKGLKSPYIDFFSERILKSGEPVKILFHKGDDEELPVQINADIEMSKFKDGWICASESIVNVLMELTSGNKDQPDLYIDEISMCERAAPGFPDNMAKIFSFFSEKQKSKGQSLGNFRNATRATLLGLQNDSELFKLPRSIMLAPIHVANNSVGGIAYIGRTKVMYSLTPVVLSTLARTLLTGLRLREEALRELASLKHEALSKARADFIQNMSHKIHDPADVLWRQINESVKQLQGLEEDANQLRSAASEIIQAFAKKEVEAYFNCELDQENIWTLIEEAKSALIKQINETKIKLLIDEFDKDWDFCVDKPKIHQVLEELLTNALRYARSEIRISVERQDKLEKEEQSEMEYVFRISDDGSGIDPSVRSDIFKAGISGATGREGERRSHGYGLYFSRQIALKHNGKLDVNDEYQCGTQFVLRLPQKKSHTEKGGAS